MSYLLGWGILVGIILTTLVWLLFRQIKEGFQGGGDGALKSISPENGDMIPDSVWDEESAKQLCPYLNTVIWTMKETVRNVEAFQTEDTKYGKMEEIKDVVKSYISQMKVFKCDKVGYKIPGSVEEVFSGSN